MGKDRQPSIDVEAGDYENIDNKAQTRERLHGMIVRYGEHKRLGSSVIGELVLRKSISSFMDGKLCFVEIRAQHSASSKNLALSTLLGDVERSYVFSDSGDFVFDFGLDRDRGKWDWMGLPEASLRRGMTETDTTKVNEVLDLMKLKIGW